MKICHVITRLILGGAQENTLLTCEGLVEAGHEVLLLAGGETGSEGSLWPAARSCGCELVELGSLRRAIRPVMDFRARRELKKIFLRFAPDIVHTHSSKAGIIGRWAAVTAKVPTIIHSIHGMSFNRTQGAITRAVYRALERSAARHTSLFITVADSMIDQSVVAGIAPRDRFVTIRSGMETEHYYPQPDKRAKLRDEWNFRGNHIVVGTVARLFDNKGYDEIITAIPKAIQADKRFRFVWFGNGARRAQYESRLHRLGVRNFVHFAGLVDPRDLATALNGLDMLVHASRWEGLPRSIVQALLTEIPVVSFDNDGAPEVVIPNETGLLVPLGNVDGLVAAMIELANDPALRKRLGRRGRALALGMFDTQQMVDKILAAYRRFS